MANRRVKILLFIGAITACSENEVKSLSADNSGAAPQISVHPPLLDFGLHLSDETPLIRSTTITNIGSGNLSISPVSIHGDQAASFVFIQNPEQLNLQPNEEHTLQIQFEAATLQDNAHILLQSNATDHPELEIPLTGQGAFPDLKITPSPLDFGTFGVQCSTTQQIILSNQGLDDLTVYSIAMANTDAFEITELPSLPLTLESGAFSPLDIVFSPQSEGAANATMDVLSNDPENNGWSSAALQGTGFWENHTEQWVIEQSPPSDIIFSVDLSSSMSDEAQALGQQFETFITELSNYTSNWQVMVVNADHGCTHSGILTESTPDYANIFLTAAQTGAYDISFSEALLTAVTHAVEKTDPTECNEGFLRPGAMLHIVMLSDECEQSPNPGICGTQWEDYIARVIAQKGDQSLVRMSAIAGDYPAGCGNPQTAEFGSGYWQASQLTGGTFLSICSDWTDPLSLQQLAATSVSQTAFALAHPPITQSISVVVDGVPDTTSWIFDEPTNAVVFVSNPPQSGSSVDISYASLPVCGQ